MKRCVHSCRRIILEIYEDRGFLPRFLLLAFSCSNTTSCHQDFELFTNLFLFVRPLRQHAVRRPWGLAYFALDGCLAALHTAALGCVLAGHVGCIKGLVDFFKDGHVSVLPSFLLSSFRMSFLFSYFSLELAWSYTVNCSFHST